MSAPAAKVGSSTRRQGLQADWERCSQVGDLGAPAREPLRVHNCTRMTRSRRPAPRHAAGRAEPRQALTGVGHGQDAGALVAQPGDGRRRGVGERRGGQVVRQALRNAHTLETPVVGAMRAGKSLQAPTPHPPPPAEPRRPCWKA